MGVRLLLDTQIFFWVVHPRHAVPPSIADAFAAEHADIVVSAISAYEVGFKVMMGRFAAAAALAANWSDAVSRLGASALAVTTDHALRAGSLDWEHRDPFDRIIAAQALVEDLTVVTSDRELLSYPPLRTLAW